MIKKIQEFLESKPGYLKKSPKIISEKLGINNIETIKKVLREEKLKAKGLDVNRVNNPKRLFFDIETTPNTVFSWSIGYKVNLDFKNIITERKVICVSYKWEHESKVHSIKFDIYNREDYQLLEEFSKIVEEADYLIGHNSNEYDIKFLRGRCLQLGISFPAKFNTVDTYKEAKKLFRLNSNKLDYIAQYLGVGSKTHTDFDMWKDICLNGDHKQLTKMIKYCENDVLILEKVYNKIKPYLVTKKYRMFKIED